MKRFWLILCCFGMIISLASCSRNALPIAPVTGTILYQGKPAADAYIQFHSETPETCRSATGMTDANGVYTLSTVGSTAPGAMPGKYRVTVSKMVDINKDKVDSAAAKPGDAPSDYVAYKEPEMKNLYPAKWALPETSGLTAEVKKGKNTFDFKLE